MVERKDLEVCRVSVALDDWPPNKTTIDAMEAAERGELVTARSVQDLMLALTAGS